MSVKLHGVSDMEIFVRIADCGSLAAAAKALGTTPATMGRVVSRLEERLGVKLLERSTRRSVMTNAGEQYLEAARRIVSDINATEQSVAELSGTPCGLIRVTALPDAVGRLMGQLLVQFRQQYSKVDVEYVVTTRSVDLVQGNYDVAWRGLMPVSGKLPVPPSVRITKLGPSDFVAVASHEYLQRHGRPQSVEDLKGHTCLALSLKEGAQPIVRWPLLNGDAIEVAPALMCNDPQILRDATLSDSGITLLPNHFVAGELADGTVELVLGDTLGKSGFHALLYPEVKQSSATVKALIEFVGTRVRAHDINMLLWSYLPSFNASMLSS